MTVLSSRIPQRPSNGNIPALTGLRGVAAVWVMLYHMFTGRDIPVVEFGYVGVDIFFVLSGFVLAHVYLRDPGLTTGEGYLRFLGVRLARVYPLHVLTLVCLLLITIALPGFTTPFKFSEERFGLLTFIANLFLVQQ
jgi:acyltransferase